MAESQQAQTRPDSRLPHKYRKLGFLPSLSLPQQAPSPSGAPSPPHDISSSSPHLLTHTVSGSLSLFLLFHAVSLSLPRCAVAPRIRLPPSFSHSVARGAAARRVAPPTVWLHHGATLLYPSGSGPSGAWKARSDSGTTGEARSTTTGSSPSPMACGGSITVVGSLLLASGEAGSTTARHGR